MHEFPREVGGHVLDRERRLDGEGLEYDYWCLDCGLELDEVDEATLESTPCDGSLTDRAIGEG